jgi:hypothetical protein
MQEYYGYSTECILKREKFLVLQNGGCDISNNKIYPYKSQLESPLLSQIILVLSFWSVV